MFPFQQIPNPYLSFNVDLPTSQSLPFPNYMSKPDISNRMLQMLHQDPSQAYANLPSLLNKRSPPIELNPAPTKHLVQEGFPYSGDPYRIQELNKSLNPATKVEEMNPQKLLLRTQQELYGLPKNQTLAAQQFPGFGNGMAFQNMDLAQAYAQGEMDDNRSLAYIKQFLESKGMNNNRDFGVQMQPQMNEAAQKYMANLYGLQNGLQANVNLQNLASLGNLGNLGNLGSLANLSNLGALGGLGNLSGLGNLANLGNLGNLAGSNNPVMLDLLNQSRNQQLLQQLNQSLNTAQSAPYLQEVLRNDPSLRSLSIQDLMLLNSAVITQQPTTNLLSQISNVGGLAGALQQQGGAISPNSLAGNKSTAQTYVLQRPEPQKPENALRREGSGIRSQGSQNPIEVPEDNKVKPVVLVKPEVKHKQQTQHQHQHQHQQQQQQQQQQQMTMMDKIAKSRQEQMEREMAAQKEKEFARQNEMRMKKPELTHNNHNNSFHHQHNSNETAWEMNKEMNGVRKNSRTLQMQLQTAGDQNEKMHLENGLKKSITPNERGQRNFFGAPELERQSQTPQQAKGKKIDLNNGKEWTPNGNRADNKMIIEERKSNSNRFNDSFAKTRNGIEIEKNRNFEIDTRKQSIGSSQMLTLNRTQSLMSNASFGDAYAKGQEVEDMSLQKVIPTKRGIQYQAMVPELTLNDETEQEEAVRRRPIKIAWDPEEMNQRDLGNYFKNLQRALNTKVISQEKALKILSKNNFEVEKTLDIVRRNERHYSNYLGISNCTRELRSRRNID